MLLARLASLPVKTCATMPAHSMSSVYVTTACIFANSGELVDALEPERASKGVEKAVRSRRSAALRISLGMVWAVLL